MDGPGENDDERKTAETIDADCRRRGNQPRDFGAIFQGRLRDLRSEQRRRSPALCGEPSGQRDPAGPRHADHGRIRAHDAPETRRPVPRHPGNRHDGAQRKRQRGPRHGTGRRGLHLEAVQSHDRTQPRPKRRLAPRKRMAQVGAVGAVQGDVRYAPPHRSRFADGALRPRQFLPQGRFRSACRRTP